MSNVTPELRRLVEERANHHCEYCQTQEMVIGMPLEIEHIIPDALGGETSEDNTCLACPRCNRYKGIQIAAFDSEVGAKVQLFNPRQMQWSEHFAWQQDGLSIIGLTPIGRVTIAALQMNNPFVVRSRRVWVMAGWHPPYQTKLRN